MWNFIILSYGKYLSVTNFDQSNRTLNINTNYLAYFLYKYVARARQVHWQQNILVPLFSCTQEIKYLRIHSFAPDNK